MPCTRVITCWHMFFPVEAHLRRQMTEESWERFCRHVPKDKITSLLELIEAAKKHSGQNEQR